jgi:ParB/RepB/Spo0J family partition protein
VAKAAPLPFVDASGWFLVEGDEVQIVTESPAFASVYQRTGTIHRFGPNKLLCYVQLPDRPGEIMLGCNDVRWMMPARVLPASAPHQRVRVVFGSDADLLGQLGTVKFLEIGEPTQAFVEFDNGAYAGALLPVNDLARILPPVIQYVPAAEPAAEHPAIEEDSDLPFLNDSAKPTEVVSAKAQEVLEMIMLVGGQTRPNDFQSAASQASLAELLAAGLVEQMGSDEPATYRATAAGIAACPADDLAAVEESVQAPITAADIEEAAKTPTATTARRQEPVAPFAIAGQAAFEEAHEPATELAPVYTPTKMKLVPLADIIVTSNTRKVFDETALGELAESIKAQGVIAPITVRPHGTEAGKFELVAGERRYRASKLAEQQTIPAVIRTLNDREFLEIQLLENLQRVDVRPADEAQAFAKLIANGYSAEEIGLKVGKGEKFVLQRAKLAELGEFWIELLLQERLPLVAAHQVARLPAAAQQIVQRYIEKEWSYQLKNGNAFEAGLISRIISEQVLRELNRAPFPLDDATLYPKAGACLTCPKRSCAVPRLFDEPERTGSDLCLDGACYGEKKVRLVARQIKALTAQNGQAPPFICLSYYTDNKQAITKDKYTEAQPGAEGAVQAVVVEGPEAGTLRWVVVKSAVANHEQKKADRSAEIRKAKIDEANRALLTRHLYTQALSGRVLEQHVEQELYGQLRSQGGPHTPLRLALANDFGWELPEGGEAALRKLTPASNYQGLWAWVKLNIDRLNYEQKLALYFAMLGYNCSTFDSSNGRLTGYAKLAGADTAKLLKLATESVTNTKGKQKEVAA